MKVTPVEHEICRFYVESEVKGRDPYLVDTVALYGNGICSCPHFQCRLRAQVEFGENVVLRCKHLDAARQFELDLHHSRLLEAHLVSQDDGI